MYQDTKLLRNNRLTGDPRVFRNVPLSFQRDRSEMLSVQPSATRVKKIDIRPSLPIIPNRSYGRPETFGFGDISDGITGAYDDVSGAVSDASESVIDNVSNLNQFQDFGISISDGFQSGFDQVSSGVVTGFDQVSGGAVTGYNATASGFDSILDGSILAVILGATPPPSGVKPLSAEEKAILKSLSVEQKQALANLLKGQSILDQLKIIRNYITQLQNNPNASPVPDVQIVQVKSNSINSTYLAVGVAIIASILIFK